MSQSKRAGGFVEDSRESVPLLRLTSASMSGDVREILSRPAVIPSVVAEAKERVALDASFIRSDQGQIVGIDPEREVYYGPTAGLDELRDLVGRFWTRVYGLRENPVIPEGGLVKENVAIVSGATEGLAVVLKLAASGHRVGIGQLHWSNYPNLIRAAGGEPVVLELFDEDYNLEVESLEEEIRSKEIACLLINFPTNPSGDVLREDEYRSLAAVAERSDILIVSDEVYGCLRYRGKPQSMLAFAPDRTVVVSSASKEYLIPGARVGYVIAAHPTFTNSWVPKLIRCSSSSPNVLGQRLLIEILKDEVADLEAGDFPRKIARIRDELRRRRDLLIAVLSEKGFALAGREKDCPSGGISLLAKLPEGVGTDDRLFVEKAMAMGKFSAIPGSVFGAEGCLRFGYAGMTEDAIRRLSGSLQAVVDALVGKS